MQTQITLVLISGVFMLAYVILTVISIDSKIRDIRQRIERIEEIVFKSSSK